MFFFDTKPLNKSNFFFPMDGDDSWKLCSPFLSKLWIFCPCYCQKTATPGPEPLHNSTDFERDTFQKKPILEVISTIQPKDQKGFHVTNWIYSINVGTLLMDNGKLIHITELKNLLVVWGRKRKKLKFESSSIIVEGEV